MTSRVHAWDEVWQSVEEAGIRRPYDNPQGPYLPVGENGVHYGQWVVDRLTELQATRLTSQQVLAIADLIRAVVRATLSS